MYHKVLLWNVLTPAYCNRESFVEEHYTDDAIDEEIRRSKIMKRLDQAMFEQQIIVLHEVDYVLRGVLSVEADKKNYGMISQGHGYYRNWYMGSVIMWPRVAYKLKKSEYLTVADLIRKNVKNPTQEQEQEQDWSTWLASAIKRISGSESKSPPPNYYNKAATRSNVLLHVLLEDTETDESVSVWGYHMPCAFKEPQVMEYHADELIRAVRGAEDGLHLLCIDGNFQPDNKLYDKFYDAGMRSAAFRANGEEPQFTVKTNSIFGGEFEGTLDYVWVMDTLTNEDSFSCDVEFPSLELTDNGEVPFLPSENIPSDHVWMSVTINI